MFRSPSPTIDSLSLSRSGVDNVDNNDREERDCIEQIQLLVQQKQIQIVALDFDETITVRGLQQGAPFDVIYGADGDDVIWNNIRNPLFLRALLYAIHEVGGRICIVSFQDDLVGNTEMGVVTGRALIERYMDVLLGYDRPNDLLRYNEDYILWNPYVRCAGNTAASSSTLLGGGANKNQHLQVMTMFSGRIVSPLPSLGAFSVTTTTLGPVGVRPASTTSTTTAAANRPPPDSIVFIDDSLANVTAANNRKLAKGFVAKQGIDVVLCRQIIQTYIRAQYQHPSSQNYQHYQQQQLQTSTPVGDLTTTTTAATIPTEFYFGYSSALAQRPTNAK